MVRHHREHCTLGECSVADLTTLRRTYATGFTVGPRRHVVVVHVALLGGRRDRVDHLVHARHGQSDDVHHLRFTTLEQTSAVRSVEQANFSRDRTKIARSTTVDAHVLADHTLAHQLLGERTHGLFDLLLLTSELTWRVCRAREFEHRCGGRFVGGGIAIFLQ